MRRENIKGLFETDFPLIQSPMAGVQDSRLTIAVCQAGGLGSLPCGMLSIDKVVSEIKLIKAATDKPYNLNFFCHKMPDYDQKKQSKWQAQLKPYFTELGVECGSLPNSATRIPFNHDVADAIESFHPEFISFHFGLPDKELLARVKSWGTKVVSSATTIEEALWLESKGVDGIIAQGFEAGGHRGMFLSDDVSTQVGMSALVLQIVNKVSVPVIAAGGIADSKGVQAALLLGAGAVQIGTTYLLCTEATTSQLHRSALKHSKSQHTAITNVFSGKPARGIVNRAIKELGYINVLAPDFPYASIEMTQLRGYFEKLGADDFSPLWSGQNTSGCKEISAKKLTLRLAARC
ncbi:2-nitropropane dioxygenase, NPD [Psychromonas ingrahamii 37]|uniref:Nitronate monooxygenase n=1 Tax=Psychromonas ingrahamii (strain DSM 17664 / CCUG 51855 / 37) TaxID=357804 RepID=A1SW45_PSYIN|nr:nitronate monooxygenase [Psychromonas ingrahamii]ABM03710.1 2-nitropropane dioxygenase, NPD [Psychromonas ingrahamii 37]